ncbi:MAG: CbiX/SirB N-terminal domain-containing protein [Deltaproteobacteria bacterium]|nr:CbiX/SirB N-terminal domain-containing protein [Deltaproteobacteria bacterium]
MNKTQTILLVAHGSRKKEANEEVKQLAQVLEKKIKHPIKAVFLELAEPSIEQGIDAACQNDFKKILILPYFLSQGRHVHQDIPRLIQTKQKKFPNTTIQLLDYVGKSPGMEKLLASLMTEALLKTD